MLVMLALQQRRQIVRQPKAIKVDRHRADGPVTSAERIQQRQNRVARCRHRLRVSSRRCANEADAVVGRFDVIRQASLLGDLAGELGDVDAQALRRVQPGLDVPDVRDWIEASGLDRNGAQNVVRETGQGLASVIRHQLLDRLQASGAGSRRYDMPCRRSSSASFGSTAGAAAVSCAGATPRDWGGCAGACPDAGREAGSVR